MNKPKLSICCITYNHEQFIAQAIESFLMQETDFDFEIVIGEDCSNDSTRSIIQSFADRYPGKFRLLLHEKNIGMIPNFYATMSACTGEYIAICEGDDYWTDPKKLQIQVDWMDRHSDYTFCLHRVARRKAGIFQDYFPEIFEDTICTMEGLIQHWNIAIGSMVFRRSLLPGKELMLSAKVGDQSLCYGIAAKGKYFYMGRCMGDYRYHAGGITNNAEIYWDVERVRMFLVLSKEEGAAYRDLIWNQIVSLMTPKINYLRALPVSVAKLKAYAGFAKELSVDFKQMPFQLKRKIFSKLLSA